MVAHHTALSDARSSARSTDCAISVATKARLAKLTRPGSAATYTRVRLFEELDKVGSAPVVWLAGPPGSGKTPLVADYTTTGRVESSGYSGARGDSDIPPFFFLQGQPGQRPGPEPLPMFESA